MKIGTPGMWRWIVDHSPFETVQKIKYITDIMDQRSKEIFYAKKAALQAGEETVLQQVGEGKDIMSILRMLPTFFFYQSRRLMVYLVRANMSASASDRLPENELIGQMSYVTHFSQSAG